ncbi:proline iminopeptidase [Acetivibrio ethanolgignens]|uniref:Proline iminopeptidase n=1 Tax=Acetivibrio ethanolgignens TaxID=290052 RepID=A0A0V8QD57_9FIRM|nr:proline iminopeptidase-family hydrolase [Acetivibrio ethanolgignens]KSV58523.1 proline iminopeptidase [Acetivibrio ethanolgignens]
MAKITEGYMPYLGHETYYRIVGENKNNKKAPLILLHGGPGSTHNYFEVLDCIADMDDRQLIMYDQIGCGNSYLDGCPEMWTKKTWMEELETLRRHLGLKECHILGQSWGGMMCIIYACDYKHEGVKSFILSSTLSHNQLWTDEHHRRMKYLTKETQEAIAEAERTGNYSGEAYDKAVAEFMERFCNSTPDENSPECLTRPKRAGSEAYVYGWGNNEFTPNGSLRNYSYAEEIKNIDTPCMVFSGAEDLCSPVIAKYMYDNIPNAEWHLFAHSRHMCFVEETEEYIKELIKWLNKND